MKKAIFLFLLLIFFDRSYSQLRYKVYRINKCEFTDTGIYLIKQFYPMRTFFKADSTGYRITGDIHMHFTDLTDKIFDTSEDCQILSYIAKGPKNNIFHIAFSYKRFDDNLIFGVFPFDGSEKFTEFYLYPLKGRTKKRKPKK